MSLLGGMLPPVVATLLADIGQYELKMDTAAGKMQVVDAAGKDAADKVTKRFAAAGAGIILESLHLSTEFQTNMTRLYTAAGAPKAAVQAATSQVLDMGDAVGFAGTQMAEALYHPVSAGLSLATSLQDVKYSAIEAQISGASLDDTTYSLSSVMKAFNQDASQAHDTMALLNSIVGQGDMRFQDFNVSVKNWAPTAAQMDISVQSMGSALAYLTDRGNSAEEASTRVTMGLTMMAYPSQKAATMLEGLGVASSDVSASSEYMTSVLKRTGITQNQLAEDLKQPNGIYVALTHLKTALHDAGVEGTEADSVMSKIFGGGRSDKAILSLMQNLDGLKQKYDDIGAGVKGFDQAWSDTQDTLGFKIKQLVANLENIGIRIGNVLIPAVSALVSWFDRNKLAVEGLAVAVGVVLAGATLRYVQLLTTKALSALESLATRYTAAGKAAREAAAAEEATNVATGGWTKSLGNLIPVAGAALVGIFALKDKLSQLGETHLDTSGVTKSLLDIIGKSPQAATSLKSLTSAITDQPIAKYNTNLQQLDQSLAAMVADGHADQAKAALDLVTQALNAQAKGVGDNALKYLPDYNKALTDASNANRLNATTAAVSGTAVAGTVGPTQDATNATNDLTDSLSAADQAWDQLSNNISASGALHTFQKDLLSVNDTIDQNGKSFNDSSLKGLANMEAFRSAADEIAKYRDAQKKAGVDTDTYNQTAAQQIVQLEKVWENLGVNKKAVEDYANSLGLIPGNLTTTLTVKEAGLEALAAQLANLNAKREQLGQPIILNPGSRVQARAGGGLVTGPGGPRSDSIPARLSNGEFVMQASAVSKFGVGFLDSINAGRMPAFAPATSSGGGPASGGGGGGGGGTTIIKVYLDGQELSGAMRKANLKYDYRNSGNNLSLSSSGAGGGFR